MTKITTEGLPFLAVSENCFNDRLTTYINLNEMMSEAQAEFRNCRELKNMSYLGRPFWA